MEAIQQLTQDMSASKIAALGAIIGCAIAWQVWQTKREQARAFAQVRSAVLPLIEPLAEAVFDTAQVVSEHERVLDVLTQDPEQEAIDAAIREIDAEAEEAHEAQEIARRVIT